MAVSTLVCRKPYKMVHSQNDELLLYPVYSKRGLDQLMTFHYQY